MNTKKSVEEIVKHYDNADSFLSKHRDLDNEQIFKLKRFIHFLKGTRVIDAGSGSGKDSKFMKEHDLEVYSCDISERMIEETRKYAETNVIRCDMRNLQFPDSFLDGVWCNSSLIHLKEQNQVIKEFKRV